MAYVYSAQFKNTPPQNFPEPQKWALFDLDWTLIRPTTTPSRPTLKGGPFMLYPDDWTFIPGRIERLQDFQRDGYRIGIVSNQKYTGEKLRNAQLRIENVWNALSKYFPDLVIFYSTDDFTSADPSHPLSTYRKPGNGWGYHLKFLPGSLYSGDATQDPNRPGTSWGYSDSDRQFAQNMGLPFYTPEEVFPQLVIPQEIFDTPKVVLILVGPPGSGKSTFTSSHKDFCIIESDAYRSNWNRIERAYRSALSENCKTMIDATNPSRERRKRLIEIAAEYNAPAGIVLFVNSGKWEGRRAVKVPKMAYNMYWSKFEEPNSDLEYNVPIYYQT